MGSAAGSCTGERLLIILRHRGARARGHRRATLPLPLTPMPRNAASRSVGRARLHLVARAPTAAWRGTRGMHSTKSGGPAGWDRRQVASCVHSSDALQRHIRAGRPGQRQDRCKGEAEGAGERVGKREQQWWPPRSPIVGERSSRQCHRDRPLQRPQPSWAGAASIMKR